MAPGNFAKRINIIGGPSVPHPSKIIKATPDAGGSSIISRRRNPIRFGPS